MLSSGEDMLPYLSHPSFLVDQRWKPNVERAPNCPRCDSSNTKFCYYNNYSLSQPRYFCKGCRRYWTKGGSLRNVPVGGGCRKNRRARSARMQSTSRAPSRHPNNRECHQLQPSSLRPDLVLDDPLGGSSHSSGSSTVSSMEASASDGSDIDLALLYSRFLNQCSADFDPGLAEPELPVEMDESIFELGGVVSSDRQHLLQSAVLQGHGAPDFQRLPGDVFPETRLSSDFLPSAGDLGICLDPNSSCVRQMLPAEGFAYDDVFWSASSTGTETTDGLTWQCSSQSPGMRTVQEDHLQQLHSNPFGSSWDAFGLANYEAFLST